MEKIELKSQICTTREESERLLKLGLKKETADMMYITDVNVPEEHRYYDLVPEFYESCLEGIVHIPAWSLHRLLFLIPKEIDIKGYKFPLRADVILKLGDGDYIYEKLIGVIERLIKGGYYNQDYLEEKK